MIKQILPLRTLSLNFPNIIYMSPILFTSAFTEAGLDFTTNFSTVGEFVYLVGCVVVVECVLSRLMLAAAFIRRPRAPAFTCNLLARVSAVMQRLLCNSSNTPRLLHEYNT